ncbi:hypothetical protein HY844_00585 [Candidatus Berkelbacteria bacterium]|nr:hypothetical protein [Candidatus Berkelbacteria bacterium]
MWKSLRAFEAKHGEHHALTHVKPHNRESTEEVVVVLNKYPITVFEQIRSSAFPAYALITFVGIFAPIIALLQFTMPGLPWITTGLAAVIWSFYLYEVLHALWHENPTTSWKTWIELPIVGRLVKSVYGFHLIHHAHHRSNMAISGFFGLPVPDWIFGTYYVPEKLPLDNHMTMKRSDYPNPPPPCKLIAWLDSKVGKQGE